MVQRVIIFQWLPWIKTDSFFCLHSNILFHWSERNVATVHRSLMCTHILGTYKTHFKFLTQLLCIHIIPLREYFEMSICWMVSLECASHTFFSFRSVTAPLCTMLLDFCAFDSIEMKTKFPLRMFCAFYWYLVLVNTFKTVIFHHSNSCLIKLNHFKWYFAFCTLNLTFLHNKNGFFLKKKKNSPIWQTRMARKTCDFIFFKRGQFAITPFFRCDWLWRAFRLFHGNSATN